MMKKISLFVLSLVLLVSCTTKENEEALVRESFNGYKSAILNDKGEEAVKYVDKRSIDYYADMLEKTKNADSAVVNSLNIMDKLMVLSIRHRASKEDILSFDGAGLLAYAINEGMVGKSSVVNNSIGNVTIDGDFATGQILVKGNQVPYSYHFYKYDDFWKVDLLSISHVSKTAFKQLQENSGMKENEYIFLLLEMVTGVKPGNEIWRTVGE